MNQGQRKRKRNNQRLIKPDAAFSAQRVWVDALYAAVGLFHLAATSERSQQAEKQLKRAYDSMRGNPLT